jgi:DNA-directed RNA polymerase subunit N (RpoN/RPB10)
MIIPVRCVTCGKVLADKWRKYRELVDASEKQPASKSPADGVVGSSAARVLDDMGITKMCCRRHMLTNVDAMDRI